MTFLDFIITPVVGGVIGYITNWIAIKMLFRPYTEKRIFNIRIPFTPGLVPKERHRLANKLGETIGNHLLTTEVIIETLTSEKFKGEIEILINDTYEKIKINNYTVEQIMEYILKEDKETVLFKLQSLITQNIESMLKNKSQIIPVRLQKGIKTFVELHVSEITSSFIQILDIEDVSKFLRQMLSKVIKNGMGTIASVFINTDKIFDNLIESIKEFCTNKQNYSIIVEQFNLFVDYMINKGLDETTSATVTNIVNENIYSLSDCFLKTEINSILDKKINEETFDRIKNSIFLKYEMFITNVAPSIITILDIPHIIENRINALETEEAEQIIINVVKKELTAITWFGALLGFIIGLIPVFLNN